MGNKIKFMSGVDVPNIDVSNTTTTTTLDAQDASVQRATINTASVFGSTVDNEATIDTMRNRNGGVSLGGAVVDANIAIGNRADGKGTGSIAIGNNAVASVENSIQIGAGTNNTANSLQIGKNNIYDIANNEINLYKSEHSKDIDAQTEEMRTADGGYKLVNEDGKYDWDWDVTVYIGKGLTIKILSASLNAVIESPRAFFKEYNKDTGYITFNCIGYTSKDSNGQGFDYTIDYTYRQTIPATRARLQSDQLQVSKISLQSKYDSETSDYQDLDTILQDVDLRLNDCISKKTFTSLGDVWNFLAKNSGVHGIYIKHSFDKYTYVSGMLFHITDISTSLGTEAYALQGIGYSTEDKNLQSGIQIIKGNEGYTIYRYPLSAPAYKITDIQGIEIN